jgi:methionyl-tRNA synthetase
MIGYDDFSKVELKTAHVLQAERVLDSEKLLRLTLDVGDKNEAGEPVSRIVLAGIGKQYEPETLIGKDIVIVANLEPRSLMGEISNGMIVAATDNEGTISILQPDKSIGGGWKIK